MADEVEAIEDASENEVEAMLDNEDISEGNYDPEDVEDVIDEFDNDSEQSYDDLVDAYDNPDLDKDID